ncbi:hypothetical protein [Micromonospora pallida]|uniref:hypothetical protein n=1 Tax=Micromonospora pallida TaxID=145854 RepID=UPI00114C9AF2|nr:hypothetical protein [Micromonospora pallida]
MGREVLGGCRHCTTCATFTAGAAPAPVPGPEVLTAYESYACRACGARYSRPYGDHECGPLTPVTVTITVRAGVR